MSFRFSSFFLYRNFEEKNTQKIKIILSKKQFSYFAKLWKPVFMDHFHHNPVFLPRKVHASGFYRRFPVLIRLALFFNFITFFSFRSTKVPSRFGVDSATSCFWIITTIRVVPSLLLSRCYCQFTGSSNT